MTPLSPVRPALTGDTPTTGRRRRPRWWRLPLVVGVVLGCVLVLLVAAVWLLVRGVRWLTAVAAADVPPVRPGDPVMVFPRESAYAGPVHRLHFYDETFRQLGDVDIAVGADLRAPDVDGRMADVAWQLARQVESRDGQRCFRPRVVVLDGLGREVGEWWA